MIRRLFASSVAVLLAAAPAASLEATETPRRLVIGITLHPYYSFVRNIVGDLAEVRPLIDTGFNTHAYSPKPDDIRRAMDLDVLVLNGVGHDAFALEIVEAAGVRGRLRLIHANEGVSLLPVGGLDRDEPSVNPHTFISIAQSIQQVFTIAGELGAIDPANAVAYRGNARAYAARLRRMRADALEAVAAIGPAELRCASVHGAYDYLLQEFGLRVAVVVEPGPASQPGASRLRRAVDRMRAAGVRVLFAEEEFPAAYVEMLRAEAGVHVLRLRHLTSGPYAPEGFEEGMRDNLGRIVEALRLTAERS